jgi:serine/threonine protein kinase
MDNATQAGVSPAGPALPGLDLAGRTLGDFHVLRRLGQGGMGQVYLAEQISLKRRVALKILRPDLATPSALQRFKAEAEAVARATHANIVQVHAFGEVDGMPYMALEYVEGRNLREYLEKKGPPEVLLGVTLMRQVAAALQRASELGIIHRDIKPENILLTRKGEVKVADFGLSRCLVGEHVPLNLTQSGVTMGTPLYMSPEQVEGKELDPRSDIYSFGVTCFHLFAGHPPFRGETAFEVALQHVRSEPVPLTSIRPDLPPALCAIIHKMLAKDPAARYQTCRELLKDLARVREGLSGMTGALSEVSASVELVPLTPTASTVSIPVAPPTRPRARKKLLFFAVSLLLALAAGTALGWLRQRSRAQTSLPVTTPIDADEAESSLTQQPEVDLRKLVDQYFSRAPAQRGRSDPGEADGGLSGATGLGVCRDLGLIYLESHRFDDAEELFTRLDRFPAHTPAHTLGQLGRGIVLALRPHQQDWQQSNKLFTEVCSVPGAGGAGGARVGMFLREPRWRYWTARAVYYNLQNGLPPASVPRVLRVLLGSKG